MHRRCKGVSQDVFCGYLRRIMGGFIFFFGCHRFSAFPAVNGSEIWKANNVGALRNLMVQLGKQGTEHSKNNVAAKC